MSLDKRLMPSGTLAQQRSAAIRLAPPYDFLGRLTIPFSVILTGAPGSGKSTWALPLARTLADIGPTIYATPEEGHSDTFGDKLRRLGVSHPQLYVADVHTSEGILDLVKATGAKFVILDSATHLDASSKAVVTLWRDLRAIGVSLVALAHVRTDGKMKGGTFFPHDLGAVVVVESTGKDTALARTPEKNRYGPLGEAPVAFDAGQLDTLSGGNPFGFEVLDPNDKVLADSAESYHRNPAASEALFAGTRPVGSVSRAAFTEAAVTGVITQGRTPYEVRGFYVDASGRPVVYARSTAGDDALAFAGTRGLIWRKGIGPAALRGFTEVDPVAVADTTWHLNGGHWSTDDEIRRAMFASMKERGTYDESRTSRSTSKRAASSRATSGTKTATASKAPSAPSKPAATKKAQAPRKPKRAAQRAAQAGQTTAGVPDKVLDAAADELASIKALLTDALK